MALRELEDGIRQLQLRLAAQQAQMQQADPIGRIEAFGGSTAPAGWLMCNGAAVSRTQYPRLFAAFGTTYGAGNGSTTFALPNASGRVLVGRDASQAEFDQLGETGGHTTHQLSLNEMPVHTHAQNPHEHSASSGDAGNHSHPFSRNFGGTGNAEATQRGFFGSGGATNINTNNAGTHSHSVSVNNATATNQNTGGNAAHNNLQPYLVIQYIIRAG
jgi:microcystin-dependent protein